jgi:hypothetical protein
MSEKKKKVLHVDNLIIHAENVEIIDNRQEVPIENRQEDRFQRSDPWKHFFWGRQTRKAVNEQEGEKEL